MYICTLLCTFLRSSGAEEWESTEDGKTCSFGQYSYTAGFFSFVMLCPRMVRRMSLVPTIEYYRVDRKIHCMFRIAFSLM